MCYWSIYFGRLMSIFTQCNAADIDCLKQTKAIAQQLNIHKTNNFMFMDCDVPVIVPKYLV